MRKTSLTVAIGLILTTTSSLSFAQDATLNKQLEGLKKQIEVLQQRLNAVETQSAQSTKKAVVPAAVNTEDREALTAQDSETETTDEAVSVEATPATSDDIEGLRTDIENYKYDQSRQYERQTVKSTRDTTLFGTVQLRANIQDNNTAPNTPKSSFDIGTALLGVRGNYLKIITKVKTSIIKPLLVMPNVMMVPITVTLTCWMPIYAITSFLPMAVQKFLG